MSLHARFRSFLAALVARRRVERDMDEEWRFHLDARADALMREGVPREQAERRARSEFGDPLRWKEDGREVRGVAWLYDLVSDVRYGLRQLRRSPVFAATAILTLAMGIGANTLAFSILHAVLVRELPYPDPDRVVFVWFTPPDRPDAQGGSTLQNYFAVRDRNQSFEAVGSTSDTAASISIGPDDMAGGEPVRGQRIHATLAAVLGGKPLLGSWFTEADDPPTAPRKLVLSYQLWQQRFGGQPDVIGRLVRMDGQEATISGVMPETFEFLPSIRFWVPSRWSEATMNSPSRMLQVLARLRPGVTLTQAQAEMDVLAESLSKEFPRTNDGWRIRLEPMHGALTQSVRGPLLALQGFVAVVLFIASANVAGLLLAQASSRRQELAMRVALGSSRARLTRQLITESLLLSSLGGVCGVVLAFAGLRVFVAQNPAAWLPRASGITLDEQVLAFAILVSAASALLFGVLPAWRTSRSAPTPTKGSATFTGVPHQRLRGTLVAGQVALALVLLIAAGLLANTMIRLTLNRPGIDTTNLLAFQVRLPLSEMTRPTGRDAGGFFTLEFSPRISQIFSEIRERIAVVPGVQAAAGAVASPPIRDEGPRFGVLPLDRMLTIGGDAEAASWFPITTDYFKTLDIPIRRGREFTRDDSLASAQVAIVNETLARRLWPDQDPLGREITIDFVNDPPRQVVGVVADVRESIRQVEFWPQVFVPDAQLPLPSRGWFQSPRLEMSYFVRTATDPLTYVNELRAAVAEVYRSQPIFGIRTMEEILASQMIGRRQYLMLLGAFAGIAALLALVGVYGLVAYGVGQRTHEIGIRRALGATPGAVLRLVLRQALVLTLAGVAIGVGVSLLAAQSLQSILWGVSPTDPVTFAIVAAGLAAAAVLACYVPARRALAVDPMVALRNDS